MNTGAAVGAAGFAVARLLLSVPDEGILDRMADPQGRQSWPVRNPASLGALRILSEPFETNKVRKDWAAVLGDGKAAVELRESERTHETTAGGTELLAALQERYRSVGMSRAHVGNTPADHLALELMYLSHAAARLGHLEAPDVPGETRVGQFTPRELRAEMDAFRRGHLDRFCEEVLAEIEERAVTSPLRSLPGLTLGFLDAIAELTAAPVGAG